MSVNGERMSARAKGLRGVIHRFTAINRAGPWLEAGADQDPANCGNLLLN